MIVETLVVGPLATNCHVAICSATRVGAVIDPGADGHAIIERIGSLHVKIEWIINTHGHADHIGANAQMKAAFPDAQLAVHGADAEMLLSPDLNLSGIFGVPFVSPAPDVLLHDADEVKFGEVCLRVIAVPGHTPGGIALFWPGDNTEAKPVLFSGDSLFAGSIGRTDFPGGSLGKLLKSIRSRLLVLPPETIVYPGHGDPTNIAEEAASNPYLQYS